jgi:hypothetical protein
VVPAMMELIKFQPLEGNTVKNVMEEIRRLIGRSRTKQWMNRNYRRQEDG